MTRAHRVDAWKICILARLGGFMDEIIGTLNKDFHYQLFIIWKNRRLIELFGMDITKLIYN